MKRVLNKKADAILKVLFLLQCCVIGSIAKIEFTTSSIIILTILVMMTVLNFVVIYKYGRK